MFLLLPPLFILFLYLEGFLSLANTICAAIGLIVYYLVLNGLWRIVLYIVFGGLEDDMKKKAAPMAAPVVIAQAARPANTANQSAAPFAVFVIIIIIIVFFIAGSGTNILPGHAYGAACTGSGGKAGLYGTNGNCYACSKGTPYTSPVNSSCSSGIYGVYCCSVGGGDDGGNHTYGTACNGNSGKTGLYGTDGKCYTCSNGTAVTHPTNSSCSNGPAGVYCCTGGGTQCIPTGCGTLWRCSGSYYVSGQQIRIDSCFPDNMRPNQIYSSWTGMCRQCP